MFKKKPRPALALTLKTPRLVTAEELDRLVDDIDRNTKKLETGLNEVIVAHNALDLRLHKWADDLVNDIALDNARGFADILRAVFDLSKRVAALEGSDEEHKKMLANLAASLDKRPKE